MLITICVLLCAYAAYRIEFDKRDMGDPWTGGDESSVPFWEAVGSLAILGGAALLMGPSIWRYVMFIPMALLSLLFIVPSLMKQWRRKAERDAEVDELWRKTGGVDGMGARLEAGLRDGTITYNPTPKYDTQAVVEPEPEKPSKLAGAAAFGVGAYLGYKAVAGDVEAENRKREAKNLAFQIEGWTKELRSPYLSDSSRRMYEGNIAAAQAKLQALQVR